MNYDRERVVAYVLAVTLWLIPAGALAGEEQRGEIGVLGGVSYSDEELTGDEEAGFSAGVRASYLLNRARDWGIFGDLLFSKFDSTPPDFDSLSVPASGLLVPSDEDVESLALRAGVEHLFNPDGKWRWFVAFGGGWMDVERSDFVATPPGISEEPVDGDFDRFFGSLSGGQRILVGRSWELRWELRADQSITRRSEGDDGLGGENFLQSRLLLGATWGLGKRKDSDEDGVADGLDNCAGTPRGARVDGTGCATDGDRDGVADGIDKCADTPQGAVVDAGGCPKDEDEDGVLDGIDRCSATPQGAVVDSAGCPKDEDEDGVADGIDNCGATPRGAIVDAEGCPKDEDEDGVADGIDRCSETPSGASVDAAGCPTDDDEDGVADGIDKCPETIDGTLVDETGCAKPLEEITDQMATVVLEGVFFESDSALLTDESTLVLERVARSLGDFPDLRVEVAGHTDSTGSDAHNRRLSVERAESVRDYLVSRGIDASRFEVTGRGEGQPVADNGTEEGRAKNRRVELSKIE